jgi:hypothetical protein
MATSKPSVELVGQVFGRLTVKYIQLAKDAQGNSVAICDCACGRSGVPVRAHNLKSGKTKSCGCIKSDVLGQDPFFDVSPGLKMFRGTKATRTLLVQRRCLCGQMFHVSGHVE